MNVRLIKPGASCAKQNKTEEPPDEVQIIDTIRAWVDDFKSRKANGARLELRLMNKAHKT
jgi:hypothetical protein